MAIETVATLMQTLDASRLLGPEQLREAGQMQARFPEPRAFAKELVQRGWLTPFQINQIFQGKGKDLLLGSYVLLERIGEGGMGNVFKARHHKLGKVVALKVIRKDRLTNAEAVGRFRREIQLVAQLSHPNVVVAFDADFGSDGCFLSLEYVEGTDLAKLVKRNGPLPVAMACDFIRQAALGLQHAHERGLVHRDIKPSNLLVTANGNVVKLLDLGLARLRQDGQDDHQTFTQMGVVVGTPDFLSPEQARNAHTSDIRGDLYSLGCTFFYLLTGEVVFPNKSPTEKLFAQCFEEPRSVESVRPEVPPHVSAVLRKLLSKKPELRYQTPAELAAALSGDAPPPAPEPVPVLATLPVPTPAPFPSTPTGISATPMALPVSVPTAATLPAAPGNGAVLAAAAPTVSPLQRFLQKKKLVYSCVGAVGFLFVLVLLVKLIGGGSHGPAATKPSDPGPTAGPPIFINSLSASDIPKDERFPAWQKDVVAVLGKHEHRHWGTVNAVAHSPDGRWLVSGGADRVLRFWDPTTLHEQQQAPMRDPKVPYEIRAVAFSRDSTRLVVATGDGLVRIWDIPSGVRQWSEPRVLRSGGPLTSVAITADNSAIVAGAANGVVVLWPSLTADRPTYLRNHKLAVTGVAFSGDGQKIASASSDGTVQLWTVKGGSDQDPLVIRAHTDGIAALAAAPNGKSVASIGHDRMIRFWNFADGEASRSGVPLDGMLNSGFAFSPDGKLLASCGSQTIHVWDISREDAKEATRFFSAGHDIRALAFAPDNQTLASGSDHVLRLWDTKGNKELLANTPKRPADIRALALSRDGQTLLTGGWDRTLRLWEFGSVQPTERSVNTLPLAEGVIDVLALSPDGKVLASGGYGHALRLWEVGRGELKLLNTSLRGPNQATSALAFSPDGKRFACGCDDPNNALHLWEVSGSKFRDRPSFPVAGYRVPVRTLAFASDNKHLISGGRDSAARVWDVDTERGVDFSAQKGPGGTWVFSVAAAPEGKRLAVATSDRAVRLWDMYRSDTQEPILLSDASIPGSPYPHTFGLAFSPDGRFLAGAQEGRITIWGVEAKKKVWEHELPGIVSQVAYAPDGHHLATINGNGTVYIFRLPASAR